MSLKRIEDWITHTNSLINPQIALQPPKRKFADDTTTTTAIGMSSPPPTEDPRSDVEATPRAKSPSKRPRIDSPPASLHHESIADHDTPSLSASSVTGSTRTDTTGGSSRLRRKRSPVKNMSDLRLADRPVVLTTLQRPDQLPSDVVGLVTVARAIRQGSNIIPRQVEQQAQSCMTIIDDLVSDSSFYGAEEWARSHGLQPWDASEELRLLKRTVTRTQECELENWSEAAWNARIHEPILDFVLECFSGSIRHFDVTRAPINKPYLSRHISGVDMQSKMVDFCICLAGDDIVAASQSRLKTASDSNSINHTSYQPIRDRPIAISIETKTLEGSSQEAKAQLSIWASAHLKRLRSLAGKSSTKTTHAVGITLPVLSTSGGDWTLLFVKDGINGVEVIETISVGNTKSLVGSYKLVSVLRQLGIWVQTTFRPWALENLLASTQIK
ncbi:hypothetical protein CDV31_009058 [Fusarium ambrosium]|uniref:PD-(D/E)XK nuclease-like domain-containing protein n=1 Tax=Fusarium ambrosium TaxID=131363 RepID=A0A428TX85_9HYPO|nr:hypothetical protein CDV31_009058 [Fusarium ambrosium]